jgi:predicted enzyme related to lactoylglutathione lyase
MAKATGIGGVFLRASDSSAIAQWYSTALGIDFLEGAPFAILPADAPGSITVFAMFGRDDPYIGDPDRQAFMVNFRVDDLDGVIERLRDVGAVAEPIVEEENGRFSWTVDPQGNRIELWEPKSAT